MQMDFMQILLCSACSRYPLCRAAAGTAFTQTHSMVITEKAARKFFGDDKNVMGRTVRLDNKQDYKITGVVKDLPENNSIQFEWLVPFRYIL